jgi:4-hydroxybenzoate polyprenyltransferase
VRAALRSRGRWAELATGLGLLASYARSVGGAFARAERTPEPETLQRAVGAGVMGLAPLQAGMLAGHGSFAPAAAVAGARVLARFIGRRPVS